MGKLKIALIAGLLLSTTAIQAAPKNKIPYVTKDVPSTDRCLPDDPNGPCIGRLITVKNPMRKTQVVTVECQGHLLRTSAVIRPGRRVTFDLGSGSASLDKEQCAVLSFWPWDGKTVVQ